jgi:carbamoyl-phosphate synthase large subunit
MKRVLITAAGGAPAINFARSLRDAPEKFYLVGCDCNEFSLMRAEVDERVLVPRATDPDFIPVLKDIISTMNIDFVHAQPDVEVGVISTHRDELGTKVFLPAKRTVDILRDKFSSYEVWKAKGLKVPDNMFVSNEEDLRKAFDKYGEHIWIREVSGAAGKGALASPSYGMAREWIIARNGWGRFVAAQRLTNQTVTWMALYKDGEFIVAQGRKRWNWLFADRTQSGVTGITGVGETISDPGVNEIAQKAVYAVDERPNGIFSVDFTYDEEGVPNPTEVNIGKFFTTHYFFTKAGLNMPYLYMKLAFNEPLPELKELMNPLPDGCLWIRGMDIEPILTTHKEIEKYKQDFEQRKGRIHSKV